MNGSKKYELNTRDGMKILVGLGVALAGAALTYAATVITEVDFGSWTPIVVAGFAVVANVVRKWVTTNSDSDSGDEE